ncbi:tetratricopeptide repeat-containing sensor histidine kinase [Hyunsoonleella ulvae]|uniref:tetratricopeptide repeat-containing sensor histidine kinase n=1 Tax=Hyunsoonleella ulvae TaxID=2799948 RepID=UPI0019395141|nr:sensor histidine kinase [Hyunsoonleella ulvae]
MIIKIKYFIIPAIFLIAGFCIGQNHDFSKFLDAYNVKNYIEAGLQLKNIDTSKILPYDKATWLYYLAKYNSKLDNQHIAYEAAQQSKIIFNALGKQKDVLDCNFLLLNILSHQNELNSRKSDLIKEIESFAKSNKDTTALIGAYHNIAVGFLDTKNGFKALEYFKKINTIYRAQGNSLKEAHNFMNIGTVHYSLFENADSALHYTKIATPILLKFKDYKNLAYNYNNQAQQYKHLKEYPKAIRFYKKADSIILSDNVAKTKVIFYTNLSDAYLLNKDFKNAAIYLDKLNRLKDSINDVKQNIAISEIKEKYDNEKLRADNLESENKRKQSVNLLIGAIAFIILGGTIMLLIQKNTRKKQKLAEQAKVLESQRLATVLKEQELVSIDAMIEGQEKERQRIANDLHDDLGGLMATVKLHFNALKDKQTPELFDKTTTLLDDAYQKIRSIAHVKNSGVIAKQGLLVAVKNMADKISMANTISVEVTHHGLENRLENSLELTIFRIIQELITNVIKHAEATEATIHLTNHDDVLNIMIEDNGVGFNPKQVTKSHKGMGISSIDKRVEHLNGKMTIESEKSIGTTIIIDIPI